MRNRDALERFDGDSGIMTDDPLALARETMLKRHLGGRDISDPRVLDAMRRVPREEFVPEAYRDAAYDDRALGIGCGQTISQPYVVAAIAQACCLNGSEHVLDVGTGSGYQAAVLAELAASVVTIERHGELSRHAAATLDRLGYKNILCVVGDGTLGYAPEAPYDAIVAAAATLEIPPALFEQLRDGGRMVLPLGGFDDQVLYAIRKHGAKSQMMPLFPCRFVPLVPEDAEGRMQNEE
ncbi:MAG: protein-L-isoaspartate O-methyltransferase [Planctomycetota bacterium]|nr:MAG: protein-L-isoaspartate O-methyltransferase [Planctomycetota bacterium]